MLSRSKRLNASAHVAGDARGGEDEIDEVAAVDRQVGDGLLDHRRGLLGAADLDHGSLGGDQDLVRGGRPSSPRGRGGRKGKTSYSS